MRDIEERRICMKYHYIRNIFRHEFNLVGEFKRRNDGQTVSKGRALEYSDIEKVRRMCRRWKMRGTRRATGLKDIGVVNS